MIIRKGQPATHTKTNPGFGTEITHRYSDAGGLTQFGASVQTLLPGGRTSLRHWHEHTDEMIYVLEGQVTVTENDGDHVLHAGDAACWPAGVPNAHTVANRSNAPCSFVIIGTRNPNDVGHYVEAPPI